MKNKKLVAVLTLLCFLFTLMPTMALAANATADYTIVLSGGKVYKNSVGEENQLNDTGINGSGDADNGYIYTFSGVNFATTAAMAIKIADTDAVTINLIGISTIQSGSTTWQYGDTCGIYVSDAALTISGEGTLNVTAGNSGGNSRAIFAYGSLTITGGTVNATSGTAGESSNSIAINMSDGEGDILTVSGNALVTAFGHTCGISAYRGFESSLNVYSGPNKENVSKLSSWNGKDGGKYMRIGEATASTPQNYDVWVGGERVTSANAADVFGDGKVSYVHSTKTLTLDNFNGTTVYEVDDNCYPVIYSLNDIVIKLERSNSITLNNTMYSHGIYCKGNLTFIGNGTLNVTQNSNKGYDPIQCEKIITFGLDDTAQQFTGTVTVNVGEEFWGEAQQAISAYYKNDDTDTVIVRDIIINGGVVEATNNSSRSYQALKGNVIVNDGTLIAKAKGKAIVDTLTVGSKYTNAVIKYGSSSDNISNKKRPTDGDYGYSGNAKYIKVEKCSHAGGEATCQAAAKCDACGVEYGTVNSDNHVGTADVFEANNDGTHAVKYSECGHVAYDNVTCSSTDDNVATCQAAAKCDACGVEYGTVNSSKHAGTPEWVRTEDTHKKVYSCCSEIAETEENHTWSNGVCSVCGYGCNNHTGGKADCTNKAVCEICGQSYGEVDSTTHSSLEFVYTPNNNGTHLKENSCCKADVAVAEACSYGSDDICTLCGYKKTSNPDPTPTPDTTPSSSGGGFSGKYNYPVNTGKVEGANVTFSKNYAVAGDTVTITVAPEAGKQIDEVIITDKDGNVITATKVGENKYSFTMPEGEVNVEVKTKATEKEADTEIVLQINNKNVVVDGKTIQNDVVPVLKDGRTLVPIRIIIEIMGGDVDWDAATRTVTIELDGKVMKLVIDEQIPGFGQGATIMDNRTYVPIRYVVQYIGAEVEWNAATQQIFILK